ncbi:hypothetical protein ABLB84_19670 [Xenorhabdus szentirmaii]|uniref:hypothetical protein n=1 Tax=Xenorhabdus szentirmaii TaxID=290112 RepID=UPI0032B763EB
MNITQSPNSDLDRNLLIYNQTPNLAFDYTLVAPLIVGQLPNSLIFSQTPDLASAYNLSNEDIGMQSAISDNLTLGVTGGYSQTAVCVTISYSQILRNSFRSA